MRQLFTVIVCFLLFSSISCSYQTEQRQIYLQQQERYTLQLDELYSFTASNFSWPSNLPMNQVKIPYQLFDKSTYQISSNLKYLASFEGGQQMKYYLGYQRILRENTNITDIVVTYYNLEIDSTTGIMQRRVISTLTLIENVSKKFVINASFYSETCGFITYADETLSSLKHFEYIPSANSGDDGSLLIKPVSDNFISKHASRMYINSNQQKNVYVLHVGDVDFEYFNQELLLSKYDEQKEVFYLCDKGKWDYAYFTSQNLLISFYSQYTTAYLRVAQIDYLNEKLVYQRVDIPELTTNDYEQRSAFVPISLQQMNQLAIVTVKNQQTNVTSFIRLQLVIQNNQGYLQKLNIQQIPLILDSNQRFFDENHLIFAKDNALSIVNTASRKITYEQSYDSSYSINLKEYIGNQFFLNQNIDNLVKATPFKVQNPTLTLIGGNQNLKYSVSVATTDNRFGINLNILVNTTTGLVPQVLNNPTALWNILQNSNLKVYTLPVEDYITGLTLNSTVQYNGDILQEVELRRLSKPTFSDSEFGSYNITGNYQTDGEYSSMIVNQKQDGSYRIAAIPAQTNIHLYEFQLVINSDIKQVDNFGSFTTISSLSTQNKIIYIPIYQKVQELLEFQIQCNTQINFASDPYSNAIFVLCDSKIQYFQFEITKNQRFSPYFIKVISQQELTFDIENISSLICIKGKLYVYNDSQIASFDYYQNQLGKSVIQIPQLSTTKSQRIVLFSQSFIVAVLDDQIQTIKQYSYGNFENQQPTYLRQLYLNSDYPINPLFVTISKRNKIEYLFLGTKNQDEYLIYRMDKQYYSQNQLYTPFNLKQNSTTFPIVSSEYICSLQINQKTNCQQIFEQTQISYLFNVTRTSYYTNLVYETPINLQFGQQEQLFDLKILRNATAKQGVVFQDDDQIQKLRTQIQDTNFTNPGLFIFDDSGAYSSCLVGWTTNSRGIQIYNKTFILSKEQDDDAVTSQIMYGYQINIGKGQITNNSSQVLFQNDNINTNCIVYDDQGSKTLIKDNNYSIDVYIFCPKISKTLITVNMIFTQSQPINDFIYSFVSSQLKSVSNLSGSANYNNLQKIVSNSQKLFLFDTINSISYGVNTNQQTNTTEIVLFSSDSSFSFSPISVNVINNNQLKMSFYLNGLITIENKMNNQNSISNLYQLIEQQGFSLQNSIISSIQQTQDNQFRVQFKDYFIFELAFGLDNNNNLLAKNIKLYYYTDIISKQVYSVTGGNFTAIIGYDKNDNLQLITFNSKNEYKGQLLIDSALPLTSYSSKRVNFATFINSNKLQVYFDDGQNLIISVYEFLILKFLEDRSVFDYSYNYFYPLLNDRTYFDISLNRQIVPKPSSSSATHSSIISVHWITFVGTLLVFITLL